MFNLSRKKTLYFLTVIFLIGLAVAPFYIYKDRGDKKSAQNTTVKPTITVTPTEDNVSLTQLSKQILTVPEKYQKGAFATQKTLMIPKEFQVSVFMAGLSSPRGMVIDPQDNVYFTDNKANKVYMIPQGINNSITVDQNLKGPHGIDFYKGDLYVAEENEVVAYRSIQADGNYKSKDRVITKLPSGGDHVTRTIKIGPDEKIYLTIGSSCNICEEKDEKRATMMRYNLDGTGEEIFATGLRNTVGFTFDDEQKIWSVDNGRDRLGNDIPPEEVNIIEKGKNYGWPYCYGKGTVNPEYENKKDFCQSQTAYPKYEMQAHSAPLDIAFWPKNTRFDALNKNVFITFHGSWNRTPPTGYKVVRINTTSGEGKIEDFITGFQDENNKVWGRPVSIAFNSKGEMFITDDAAGAIYQVKLKS